MSSTSRAATGPSRRAVLATTAALPLLAALRPAPAAAAGWTWDFFTYGTDLWQRNYWNGTGAFDFRLGGGGCIAQMRHCPSGYKSLLSPTYAGEETDRVMQSVLWGLNVEGTAGVADKRWNIDQAGDRAGTFQRTVVVERPSADVTDVWTIADKQWYAQLSGDFAGSDPVPQLTRYTRSSTGAMEIRRVLRLPKIVKAGATVSNVEFYLENWLPFLRKADTFTAMAVQLDTAGNPSTYYRAGVDIPRYPWTPAETTSGFAMVYKLGAHQSTPNVAVCFSTSPGLRYSTSATLKNVRNSMDWDTGIGVLPGARIAGGEAGSILDYTVRIVAGNGTSAGRGADLSAQAAALRVPALYGPAHPLSGEIATLAGRLRGYLTSSAGTRTNHLAGLLT